MATLQRRPDLFLPGMVVDDAERDQLLERERVGSVEVEQRRTGGSELQALAHHRRGDEEAGRDLFLAETMHLEVGEGAVLVEWVEGDTLDVLGQAVLLGEAARAYDAGDRRVLGEALLLHQQLESTVTASAGRDLEAAGLGTDLVEDRTDVEALEQGATGDVLGELLDREAGLEAADIGLGEFELAERMSREALRTRVG